MINSRGFSLTKILIMVAISLAFLVAITSIAFQQAREVNALVYKAVMENVSRDLENVLTSGINCLNAVQGLRIDDTRIGQAKYFLEINQIVEMGTVPRSVIAVGQTPADLRSRIQVTGLRFENIARTSPNRYEATLVVLLEASMQTLEYPSVRLAIITDAASPAASKTPTSCTLASGGSPGSLGVCRVARAMAPVGHGLMPSPCASGETAVSGGVTCLLADGSPQRWDSEKAATNFVVASHRELGTGSAGNAWVGRCRNDTNTGRAEVSTICCRP